MVPDRHLLVEELSRVFVDVDDASLFLAKAGFPRETLPELDLPIDAFWWRVVNDATSDRGWRDVRWLLTAAMESHPDNLVFQRLLRLLDEPDPHEELMRSRETPLMMAEAAPRVDISGTVQLLLRLGFVVVVIVALVTAAFTIPVITIVGLLAALITVWIRASWLDVHHRRTLANIAVRSLHETVRRHNESIGASQVNLSARAPGSASDADFRKAIEIVESLVSGGAKT